MRRLGFLIVVITLILSRVPDASAQSKLPRSVNDQTVEKILQGMQLKYTKNQRKEKEGAITNFYFKRGDASCRLTNYGSDLWIEWQVDKKLKLDDVNRWNAQAKFSRLVLIDADKQASVSLEAQLDCLGGVTDALIRQFINRFDDEAKKFAKSFPK